MKTNITGVISAKHGTDLVVNKIQIKRHPIYEKQYRVTKKYLVHNPKNEGNIGDTVEITESKPISKRKRWILSKIIK